MPNASVVTRKHSEAVVPRSAEIGRAAPHCASEATWQVSAATALSVVVFSEGLAFADGVVVDGTSGRTGAGDVAGVDGVGVADG
jgi:hypothetical protein